MMFRHSQKVIIEMGPLTLAAIAGLTTAVDNLTANLPVDSDDASDAALIDTQTARVVALTPVVPVPAPASGGDVPPTVTPTLGETVAASTQFSG